jgi:hypothetical protein
MGDEIEIMQCFAYEHLPAELAEIVVASRDGQITIARQGAA